MMRMTQTPTQTQCQEKTLLGGLTHSIFKKSEAWLMENSDRQKAIQKIRYPNPAKNYQSVMDFLFCEVFEQFKKPCFDFYRGSNQQLRGLLTEEEILSYDETLLRILKLGYDLHHTQQRVSWKTVLSDVFEKAS
jgi:hypothetical protein